MDSSAVRRPCFIEGDDGLASLAEMEAGLSETSHHHTQNHPFFSRASYYSAKPKRRSSLRNLSLQSPIDSSPRLGSAWYDARYEGHRPHFLEVCFLCKKPLGDNRDIFMYRGDTPFCSEDCRQEQIDKDEAKEKNSNHSASMKALRSKTESKKSSSSSPIKNQDYPYRPGTVAAA
ncbi:hypothetical protein Nepgr_011111 [Nepenthes gracilis]|uniref:FLZ-type domain-containing protein n=1 Tax=Nepenthes gracilis TaxID=150966 RepID=A0AAD3XLZ9_NEPGR|nr:hypothetical protein Nepgr_011111 [Nepenthes gracilis]